MADADSVDITVKINDEFSGTIERLKQQLDSIDDIVEVLLKIKSGDIDKTVAELEAELDGKVTKSTHIVNEKHGNTLDPPEHMSPGITNQPGTGDWFERMEQNSMEWGPTNFRKMDWDPLVDKSRGIKRTNKDGSVSPGPDVSQVQSNIIQRESIRKAVRDAAKSGRYRNFPDDLINQRTAQINGNMSGRKAGMLNRGNLANPAQPAPNLDKIGGTGKTGVRDIDLPSFGKRRKQLRKFEDTVDGIGKKFRKLMPTMRRWMNLIAALIPMLVTLGVAALGVASAITAVAAAGAGMVGIGLLGFDDTSKRLQEFKEELKTLFEPVMKAFKPIADMFLSRLVTGLQGVASALQALPVFLDSFDNLLGSLIQGVENLIKGMVAMEPVLSQLSNRFTDIILSGIGDFFQFLVEEAYQNQEAMMDLGEIFIQILGTIYNLSEAVSALVISVKPLFGILLKVSDVLNNQFSVQMLKAITLTWTLVKAMKALRAITMTTGIGLALTAGGFAASEFLGPDNAENQGFGGGPSSGQDFQSSGDNYYVMNVDGNVQDQHMTDFRRMDQYHEEQDER